VVNIYTNRDNVKDFCGLCSCVSNDSQNKSILFSTALRDLCS